MIYNQFVQIKSNSRNKRHYLEKGYDVPKTGQFFIVKVDDLLPSARELVKCKCDICGCDFERRYCYIKNEVHACSDKCVQELRERTNELRYGCKNPGQSELLNKHKKERNAKTKYHNHSINTSKIQLQLHNLLGGELNYPLGDYNLDIAFIDKKIDIEYDGGGHFEWVKDDLALKELQRDNQIVKLGWRVIRIESRDDIILNNIKQLIDYAISLNKKKVFINIDTQEITYYDKILFGEIL